MGYTVNGVPLDDDDGDDTAAPTKAPTKAPTTSSAAPTTEVTTQQNTDAPTLSPARPTCKDASGKFTITNKKGTKTSTVKCKKLSIKKCSWRDESNIKIYKKCPVRCQSKITPKNLAKLWCEHE